MNHLNNTPTERCSGEYVWVWVSLLKFERRIQPA
jgi:hypothetical protein